MAFPSDPLPHDLPPHDLSPSDRSLREVPAQESAGSGTDFSAAGPFSVRDAQWRMVSPRLATSRRVLMAAPTVLVTVGFAIAARWLNPMLSFGVSALGVTFFGWAWWVIGCQVRATGYTERADDVVIRTGIVFRRIVVVPYGRLQFVDVTAGPVARLMGYSAVQLHTASTVTAAVIPGVLPEEATRLREHLAGDGHAKFAGL
ncbi:MAG: PH domain-containing protein [Actinomycetota bacterium]